MEKIKIISCALILSCGFFDPQKDLTVTHLVYPGIYRNITDTLKDHQFELDSLGGGREFELYPSSNPNDSQIYLFSKWNTLGDTSDQGIFLQLHYTRWKPLGGTWRNLNTTGIRGIKEITINSFKLCYNGEDCGPPSSWWQFIKTN